MKLAKWFVLGLLAAYPAIAAESAIKSPTFNKDVLPILQKNCQTCHRPGQMAPMSLVAYQDARPWAKAMKYKVVSKEMPPWNADPKYGHFANDRSLAQKDIDTIAAWADQGALEGNANDAPAPVRWPEAGWQIQPDMVVDGPAVHVPARTKNNVMEWMYYVMPGDFKKDTWITSMEIKPGDYSVTHHVCISFLPHRPDTQYNVPLWREVQRDDKGIEVPKKGTASTALAAILRGNDTEGECWLPGTQPIDYRPHGAGKLIPAGTDVVFNVHYTPNNKNDVDDMPKVGFTVAKEAPERKYLTFSTHGPQDRNAFAITPNDANWQAPTGVITFLEDAELVWMSPHMHLRGKDMTYTIVHPDGTSEIVLNVPRFDFNWQLGYVPAEPVKVTKGSKLVVTGHFDNSANNKYNPDPNQTVYYGNMVWEEMFGGRTGIVVSTKADPKKVYHEETPDQGPSGNGG